MRIAFLGLGSMGRPMALNLARSDHELVVWNRTRDRAGQVEGAEVADTPAEAARGARIVLTMLADDQAVEAVTLGDDGLIEGMEPGATHASMSTVSDRLSRRLVTAHSGHGQHYVAAPVFGRPDAAEKGALWIVAGGDADAIDSCRPVFDLLGQGVVVAGSEPAQANVMKLAGNFMLASAIEAMAEAYTLVRAHGISTELFHETMADRLFDSAIYRNYGAMIEGRSYEPAGFKLGHGLKDLRFALAAGDEARVPMPLASLLHDRLLSAAARGWHDLDWAGLGRVASTDAGQDAPD